MRIKNKAIKAKINKNNTYDITCTLLVDIIRGIEHEIVTAAH